VKNGDQLLAINKFVAVMAWKSEHRVSSRIFTQSSREAEVEYSYKQVQNMPRSHRH
jgi:hypothetical protein